MKVKKAININVLNAAFLGQLLALNLKFMFVTHNKDGLVTAYSDKSRNKLDLVEGETEVEVDMDFNHIQCKEGSLIFEKGELKNAGMTIATQVEEIEVVPVQVSILNSSE